MPKLTFDELLQVLKVHLLEQGIDEPGIDEAFETIKKEIIPQDLLHEMGRKGHRIVLQDQQTQWYPFDQVIYDLENNLIVSTDNVPVVPHIALIFELPISQDEENSNIRIGFNDDY